MLHYVEESERERETDWDCMTQHEFQKKPADFSTICRPI